MNKMFVNYCLKTKSFRRTIYDYYMKGGNYRINSAFSCMELNCIDMLIYNTVMKHDKYIHELINDVRWARRTNDYYEQQDIKDIKNLKDRLNYIGELYASRDSLAVAEYRLDWYLRQDIPTLRETMRREGLV